MNSRMIVPVCLLIVGGFSIYAGVNWYNQRGSDMQAESSADEPDGVSDQADPETPLAPASLPPLPATTPLTLNLTVGERFPLIKTVQQTLKQPSPQGGWTLSHSNLELLLSITVEEVRAVPLGKDQPGVKRLGVKYHRVRFTQDVPGNEADYDSDHPPRAVPLALQAYHGLRDNGFQFWLDEKNQIVEVVGFDQFLTRCLRGVPPDQRAKVRAIVESTSGADGVANFIDNSIGALPNERVRENDSWQSRKKILQPVPMWVDNVFTLRKLEKDVASIDIMGTITGGNTLALPLKAVNLQEFEDPSKPSDLIAIEIDSGHSAGSCLIDRRSGLPRQSKVEQTLQMNVRLPGNISFRQEKTTVTTIGIFAAQTANPATVIGGERNEANGIRRASAEAPARN